MDRSERPLRQRSRGATLAVMAIMIAVALFAASCSGDDTPEQDSELGSGSGAGALPETTAPATEMSRASLT